MPFRNMSIILLSNEMMKHRRTVFIIIACLWTFLLLQMATAQEMTSGVSLELAQQRKSNIKDVTYELFFSIPSDKSLPVIGEVTVGFTLGNENHPVLLDFRADSDHLVSVCIDGAPVDYLFEDDHIVIQKAALKKGENHFTVRFVANNQSLNRNENFLYTLLVPDRARTVFPCFDQPNLKAEFQLGLEIPTAWVAVSNSAVQSIDSTEKRKTIHFGRTEPLSTYLFSFVAGDLQYTTFTQEGRSITAYYRETDLKKLSQLPLIAQQVFASLRWQEEYTGIPYPFAKYDFIMLPGFQYGGMEHTGATFYNDKQLFLDEHPTPDEELARMSLIAHETSHMWFGDYVTMDWFNDVWTKEVFANYYSALMTEPQFPLINHQLNWLRKFNASSMNEDRTEGTNAIQQPLDNLNNAGLIYGQIIYNKAPVVMRMMAELMGEEAFKQGIRQYLKKYAYANATWDDLIEILQQQTKSVDLRTFSDVWVKQKGTPSYTFSIDGNQMIVKQLDKYLRDIVWSQKIKIFLLNDKGEQQEISLLMDKKEVTVDLPFVPQTFIPNSDGRSYGRFLLTEAQNNALLKCWVELPDELCRLSALQTLYENYLDVRIPAISFFEAMTNALPQEKNELIATSLVKYAFTALVELKDTDRTYGEETLLKLSESHPFISCRKTLSKSLVQAMTSINIIRHFYSVWENKSDSLWSERDYTSLCYELAIRLPLKCDSILAKQRTRLSNADELREFDFKSRACTGDTVQLNALFTSLLLPENRRIEPWTQTVLSLLNHPLREQQSIRYIRPALDVLKEVQRTGDIFFPKNWVDALLGSHRSAEAYRQVCDFLNDNPDYPSLLKNKILQASYFLQRANDVNTLSK